VKTQNLPAKMIRVVALFLPLLFQLAPAAQAEGAACDRACMSGVVDQVLASMVAHNPETLPLATLYSATENSHPAALGMMTLWRTVTEVGKPDLLAIDTKLGQAFIATHVSEGGSQSVLWGRIKVVDHKIAELELFINRSRGDHGFSFSADQIAKNSQKWMQLSASRKKASRAELEKISRAAFDSKINLTLEVASDCQFLEAGSLVVDPGLDDAVQTPEGAAKAGKDHALGCMFPPFRPSDPEAREIVIDEELGIVVNAAVIPGTVYPYPFYGHMYSAFIPDAMKFAATAQEEWIQKKLKAGNVSLLKPTATTGEVMQLLQYYDGKLQGSSINVYLAGPDEKSVWAKH
jgi:hypothetical protein